MAFWTCHDAATSAPHRHDFDEYFVVVEGGYTLLIEGKRIPVKAGEEALSPRGWCTVVNRPLAREPSTHSEGDALEERNIWTPARKTLRRK